MKDNEMKEVKRKGVPNNCEFDEVKNFGIAGQTLYDQVGVFTDRHLEFGIGGDLMKSHPLLYNKQLQTGMFFN